MTPARRGRGARLRHRRGAARRHGDGRRPRRDDPTTMVYEYPSLPREQRSAWSITADAAQMFAEKAHAYAAEVLQKDGVELLMGSGVDRGRPGPREALGRVDDPDPLRHLGRRPQGGARRRGRRAAAGEGGRIDVNPDFTVDGFPGVLVIGDIANIPSRRARPTHSSARSRCRAASRPPRPSSPTSGQDDQAVLVPRQGHDGDDRPRRGGRPGQGRRAARQARVRRLARRPRRADDRRQQSRRRVQELGDRLLRQGPGARGARSERDAAHAVGRGRRRRDGIDRGRCQ